MLDVEDAVKMGAGVAAAHFAWRFAAVRCEEGESHGVSEAGRSSPPTKPAASRFLKSPDISGGSELESFCDATAKAIRSGD